jgi:hypothetical protein
MPRARASGVQKAPRHEVAGSLAPAVPQALWGFDFHAGGDGGRDGGTRRPAWVCAKEPGSVQWVSRSSRGPYRRAISSQIGMIGPREIAASVAPAHRNANPRCSQKIWLWLMTCRSCLGSAATLARSRARRPRSPSFGRRSADMDSAAQAVRPVCYPAAFADRRQAE